MDDLHPEAIKIGMVCDKDIALTIAACIRKYQPRWVVYDPVMVSTSGHKLMTDDTIEVIKQELTPLATLITPNLHEARILSSFDLKGEGDMENCADVLGKTCGCSVLIKGGHLEKVKCAMFYMMLMNNNASTIGRRKSKVLICMERDVRSPPPLPPSSRKGMH